MCKCVKWWMEWGCDGWRRIVCVCVKVGGVVVGSACVPVSKVVDGVGIWWMVEDIVCV